MKIIGKILDVVFLVCLIAFVLMSVAMLLIETGALFALNGTLAANVYSFIVPRGALLSSVAAVCTFVLSYLRREAK